jgi:hypothetical protein
LRLDFEKDPIHPSPLGPSILTATPVHVGCRCCWPNPASRRPKASGGGDEEIPHATASHIWGIGGSGSHRGRRSTVTMTGRRGTIPEGRRSAHRRQTSGRGAMWCWRGARGRVDGACPRTERTIHVEVLSGGGADTGLTLASWGGTARLKEEGRLVRELEASLSAVTRRR